MSAAPDTTNIPFLPTPELGWRISQPLHIFSFLLLLVGEDFAREVRAGHKDIPYIDGFIAHANPCTTTSPIVTERRGFAI